MAFTSGMTRVCELVTGINGRRKLPGKAASAGPTDCAALLQQFLRAARSSPHGNVLTNAIPQLMDLGKVHVKAVNTQTV
jgi:hypothetical protein